MKNTPSARPAWRNPLIIAPLAILVVGGGLYSGVWISAASVLQTHAERWITAQREQGLTITHGPAHWNGFPGRAAITYPDWSMTDPTAGGGWSWRTSALKLWALPWAPTRFTVDLAGSHAVAGVWTPLEATATITATRADVQPTLTLEGRIAEIAVNVTTLAVGSGNEAPPLFTLASGSFSITQFQSAKADEPAAWRFAVDASDATSPALSDFGVLAPIIRTARLTADLIGPFGPGPLPTALEAWRQGGGTLELRAFALDWPPLSVAASGTVALDEQLQPIGAVTAKFRGFFETVNAMTAQGLVRQADASMARIVLGLMSRVPEGGGPAELNLAVTVQNRKLYTGPLSLMAMPEVTWPSDLHVP